MHDPSFPPTSERVAANVAIDGLAALTYRLVKAGVFGVEDVAGIRTRMLQSLEVQKVAIDPDTAEALAGYISLHFNYSG